MLIQPANSPSPVAAEVPRNARRFRALVVVVLVFGTSLASSRRFAHIVYLSSTAGRLDTAVEPYAFVRRCPTGPYSPLLHRLSASALSLLWQGVYNSSIVASWHKSSGSLQCQYTRIFRRPIGSLVAYGGISDSMVRRAYGDSETGRADRSPSTSTNNDRTRRSRRRSSRAGSRDDCRKLAFAERGRRKRPPVPCSLEATAERDSRSDGNRPGVPFAD
ncbi:hypothetical protein BRC86_00510 [Halobacteriales archaeon QS_3_64_16]|nr:MAG: hypothetical protein BRC86_00510 [Halobacteriales archaeon QS_3_64_16]